MSLTACAPAASARRATSGEKVSAEIGTPEGTSAAFSVSWPENAALVSPAIAGTSAAASSSALTGGPAFAATAPTSSMSNPASTNASPSATACSGVPLLAPSNIESTVTLTIPAASGCAKIQNPVSQAASSSSLP